MLRGDLPKGSRQRGSIVSAYFLEFALYASFLKVRHKKGLHKADLPPKKAHSHRHIGGPADPVPGVPLLCPFLPSLREQQKALDKGDLVMFQVKVHKKTSFVEEFLTHLDPRWPFTICDKAGVCIM